MNFEQIFQFINKPEYGDWMGRDDCEVLYKYASKINKGLIVEIGTWLGKSFSLLAMSSPESRIVGIDPYLPPYKKIYKDFVANTKYLYNTTFRKNTSDEMFKVWHEDIDLLHVDGEHTYEQVKNDLRWFKFVKKGGVALFHDYTAEALPGVRKAINESGYKFDVEKGYAVIHI